MWICILIFSFILPCICKGSIKEENATRVITLATLIPADELRLFSILRVEPAMEIAIETVKKEAILNASTDLVLKFRDSKCDIADGINEAINFYVEKCSQRHELHVIFGPCCDYSAAPVARQVRYWNIPMITPGALARDFALGKLTEFSHVTRVGPNFNTLVNFVVSLLDLYKWGKVNLIYEPEGHTEILKRYCHIAVDGLHYGLRSQTTIQRIEQTYYKFENVKEAIQNLPKWIGRSTANLSSRSFLEKPLPRLPTFCLDNISSTTTDHRNYAIFDKEIWPKVLIPDNWFVDKTIDKL